LAQLASRAQPAQRDGAIDEPKWQLLRAQRLAPAIEESGLKLSQSVQYWYWYCFGTNIVAISGNQPTLLFGIVMRFALKVAP